MKKSQIKMSETIGVLIIFFFLVVFGFGFYVRVQRINFERELERNADLKGISVAQKAAYLPELQCTFRNIQKDNCFDELKVIAFNQSMKDKRIREYYSQFFGFSEIELKQMALEHYPAVNYTLYCSPKAKASYISTISIPVSIHDPLTREFSFALLTVKSYG